MSLAAPLWVDPAAGQSAERPSETDMLEVPIETLRTYRAWLSEFADVEEVGQLEVSGRDAVLLDGPLRQDGPTWPCADEPGLEGDRCVWLRAVDTWWWYGNDAPTANGGDYFVDGTGLVLTIEPDDQTADVTDAVQQLLDVITIRLPAATG